jgi:DNA-binding MarR family transcriptional regulator
MTPGRDDVQSMVAALFTLTGALERARRERKAAGALSLLQVIAGHGTIRPSDLADLQLVHPSQISRQVRELEDAGYVEVMGDPADGRSWLVALTPAGQDEMRRLQQVGLDRFALFVADWEPDEVGALTALLEKLRSSMAAVAEGEQSPAPRRTRPGQARRDRLAHPGTTAREP